MKDVKNRLYRFENVEIDVQNLRVTVDSEIRPLEPKSFRLLLFLAENPGRVLPKDEIVSSVWPDTAVSDNSLTRAITQVRKALDDDPKAPRYIETVPTVGYRFLANCKEEQKVAAASEAIDESQTQVIAQASVLLPSRLLPYRWVVIVGTSAVAAGLAAGCWLILHFRNSGPSAPKSSKWEQITFFTDSAVYPALSPDGRILTFIRGRGTFNGRGNIYVKLLPSGEPVQLTHDPPNSPPKLSPAFSPDGARIVYGTVDPWDTWDLPVLGGEPHLLLRNASSLTWIANGKHLLFSEIKSGVHMAVVTTDEGRGQSRDVYVPPGERSMVHHSYLSPDGRHLLTVVMGSQGKFIPCRVVPFEGNFEERVVGPPDATCTSGAWSPDGKWVYLTSDKGGKFHIWRQRFPDGQPEQVTFGPTEEEGIAMAPDGKSLLTSVGISNSTVWVHDAEGDHQLSSEGYAAASSFSSDGRKLYYLMQSGDNPGLEIWVTELATGKSGCVLPGYSVEPGGITNSMNYAVSKDGKQIAFAKKDENNVSHLWLAKTDYRSSPRQIPSAANEDFPFFLPEGDVLFRSTESGHNFLYRMRPDGADRRKIDPDPIFDFIATSPDGRWALVQTKGSDDEHPYSVIAYPVEGGRPVLVCKSLCWGGWDNSGKFLYLMFGGDQNTYVLPVRAARGLPDLPAEGVVSGADLKTGKKASTLPNIIESAAGPDSYSFGRYIAQRNIYRIPIP